MDSADFDALARSWDHVSRRTGLRWLTGGALAVALARVDWTEADAKKKKKRKKKPKRDECDNSCEKGFFCCPGGKLCCPITGLPICCPFGCCPADPTIICGTEPGGFPCVRFYEV